MTYPTFLSKRIRKSASILGAAFSLESTFVALEAVEADMVVVRASRVRVLVDSLRRLSVMQRR